MAVFSSDTFTDAANTLLQNHVGEVGATWTKHAAAVADATISNANRLKKTATGAGHYYTSGVPASNQYDVECVIRRLSSVDTAAGVIGRADQTANTLYLARFNNNNNWELYRAVSGTFTLIGNFAQAITTNQDYSLKLEIRDAAKKLYVDGVERVSSADNTITAAGRAGVRHGFGADTAGSDTTAIHLDTFVATDLSSPAAFKHYWASRRSQIIGGGIL